MRRPGSTRGYAGRAKPTFNRHFYVFKPPRPLAEIDAELAQVTKRIVGMIGELSS